MLRGQEAQRAKEASREEEDAEEEEEEETYNKTKLSKLGRSVFEPICLEM